MAFFANSKVMIKRVFISLALFDNWLTNLAKRPFRTKWVRTGQCKKCGNCCHEIVLTMTPAQTRSPLFCTLAIKWISWLFDFILLRIDYQNQALVFTCKHLTDKGECNNYRWRPNVCRNYPLIDYFKQPRFLPNCGFGTKLTDNRSALL